MTIKAEIINKKLLLKDESAQVGEVELLTEKDVNLELLTQKDVNEPNMYWVRVAFGLYTQTTVYQINIEFDNTKINDLQNYNNFSNVIISIEKTGGSSVLAANLVQSTRINDNTMRLSVEVTQIFYDAGTAGGYINILYSL